MKSFILLTISSANSEIALKKSSIESIRAYPEHPEIITISGKYYYVTNTAESILNAVGGLDTLPED